MKTFYIPVHFYEQEPEDDELIMFITQYDLNDDEFKTRLLKNKKRFMKKQSEYSEPNEIVDAIFNTISDETGGSWFYCKTMPQLIIGDMEEYVNEIK